MFQTENPAHFGQQSLARPYAEAVIDLAAIRSNVSAFRNAIPGQDVLAVVKADGFGHGVIPVAQAVLEAGANWLGVATASEALEIRQAGLTAPVLCWLPFLPFASQTDLEKLLAADVELSALSPTELDALAAAHRTGGAKKPFRVHLKIDTGIHRAGCDLANWPALVEHAARLEDTGSILVAGIWSHLSHGRAEDGGEHNRLQTERLLSARNQAVASGLNPTHLHLANSAGAIRLDTDQTTMVRIGAGIYGIYRDDLPLTFAMTVKTRISALHDLAAGEGVGYDHIWTADRSSQVGLVPLGFADGVPRDIQGAEFFVNGHRVPVVGRVSMDQTILDLTGVPVQVGDEAIMFGSGESGEPTADDWAVWANTNQHDIFCGIGARVARRYVNEDFASTEHRVAELN